MLTWGGLVVGDYLGVWPDKNDPKMLHGVPF